MSQPVSATNPTPSVSVRVPEPPKYDGSQSKLDTWLFMLKMYFGAVGWAYDQPSHSARCCSFACSLLEGNAMQWLFRMSRMSTIPTDFSDFEKQLKDQFGVLNAVRRARDQL